MDEKQFEEKLTLLDQLQSACTHCGLCAEGCATFQATGWEHESPRGRLHLAAQFLHGRISPQSEALSTFDRCLGCQACEPLCPHHVPYGQVRQIVQELRRELHASPPVAMERIQYRRWVTLARRISNHWWRSYGAKWLKIPLLNHQNQGSFAKKCKRPQVGQPILAICCMQDLFQHDVIKQTLSFVQRLGYSLGVDYKQPCCGAIFERLIHGSEEAICYPKEQRKAAALQKKTLKSFLKWMPSQTYFLSMGCQCFVNRHHQTGLDFYHWIETILDQRQLRLYLPPQEVYYQPYCGSKKELQEDPIWRLLQRIEGLIVHPISYPHACCGGYGGEILLHSQHALELSWQKISNLPEHATLIVTSPDCWSLFNRHTVNLQLTICYPIHLLYTSHFKN